MSLETDLENGDPPVLMEKHHDAVSEPAAVRMWLRLLTCSLTIEKRLRRRLADQFNTTLPRFDVLAALDRSPDGMTMSKLSQALLVSGGNLTSLVRQLEKLGYVVMENDPNDRRSWVVRISEAGKQHFSTVAEAHHHWIGAMLGGLSPDHFHSLYELLGELKGSIVREPDPENAS